MKTQQRVLSGIKPSGELHIGNYLGAISQWAAMQDEHACHLFLADLHAITLPQDPQELRTQSLSIIKTYLAAGLDPDKVVIFAQSHVSAHAELGWILTTLARMGELERMIEFKEQEARIGRESAGAGILNYPALMSADILLYDADFVPVGEDQMQHLELTRTLARRFNKKYGETFVVPKPLTTQTGARIMGLDDPTKKMSKSASSEYNYIALSDGAKVIAKKIKKAMTDSGSEIMYSDDKPALKNLINIFALLADEEPRHVVEEHAGKNYGEFKHNLTDVVVNSLEPLQDRMNDISDDEVMRVLHDGADKARVIADAKLKEVYEKVGFVQR